MATSTGDLKGQFQKLEMQQQRKLAQRKLLKDGTSNKSDTTASIAFGVDDDMRLQLEEPPLPNAGYSEDPVQQLNEQLRELKDETGRLYKLLSERDLEVRQLRKRREQDRLLLEGQTGKVTSENAATKIVELSKKVRDLSAELQSEKTKSRQNAKRVMELENELQVAIQTSPNKASSTARSSSSDATAEKLLSMDDIKSMQEKLKHSEIKTAELRNQCQSLKQELRLAQKVISQEVGEATTVQSLLSSSSGWRGRAQQIITLQKKVNDLKWQLDRQQQQSSLTSELEEEIMGSTSTRKSNLDDRQKDQIRRMEKERKEANEKLAADLKALEVDHESLKQKLEASRARNKVLSTEVKSVKQQLQTLLEKGSHDDELITALLKQQNQLKAALEESLKEGRQHQEGHESAMKKLSCKTQQENNVVEKLHTIIAEKESMVHSLEEEIKQMRMAKAQMNGVSSMFDKSPRLQPLTSASDASSQLTTVNANVEEERTSLTPSRVEDRSVSRTESHLSGRPSSRKQSARAPSIVGGATEGLEELQLQCQEYKSVYQAAQVERDKLSELVQVLQKRIEEMAVQASESQSELLSQKRKNVELEKQLGKARAEQSQLGRRPSKNKSAVRTSTTGGEDGGSQSQPPVEELQIRLDIQKDENEALKAALQSTLQAKQEDLKLYTEMIEETKRVFLQGLRQYRQGATP